MSGHSKWATTKRQKAVTDSKRAVAFTRIAKLITVAARDKGSDPETNFSLRIAIEKARAANMPKENIERSIKRGAGETDSGRIEEFIYEGIGPANSQFVVKCLTDNKNRSASNIRHIFSKFGGSLGAVMWNFGQKGVIRIASEEIKNKNADMDALELGLIDSGAEDILKENEGITIYAATPDLQKIKKYLEEKNIKTESAEIEYVAKDEIKISDADKEKIENMIEALEENEDVSDYYTNVA